MMLRNTGAMVHFRAALPAWLEPRGAAFIEVDARPMGACNSAFMAAREQVTLAHRVRMGGRSDDESDSVESYENKRAFARDLIGAVYDTCIIAWRTNLIDDATGAALTCDRATFLELTDMPMADIAKAFLDMQTAMMEAGVKVMADTEATIKN